MRIGTVIKWLDYPFQADQEVKDRWFVYLGTSSFLENPLFVYICTATTQKHHYQYRGKRSHHQCLSFKKGQFGFEQDCLVDPNMLESVTSSVFEECASQIEEVSILPEDMLRKLYNLIRIAEHPIRKIKADIHSNLNKIDMHNLKRP